MHISTSPFIFIPADSIYFVLSFTEKMDSFKIWVHIINLEGYYKYWFLITFILCFPFSMNLGVLFSRSDQFQLLFILFPCKILQTAHLELLMRSTKVSYCLKKILQIHTNSLKRLFVTAFFIRDGPIKWKEDVPAISESSKQTKYTPVSTKSSITLSFWFLNECRLHP